MVNDMPSFKELTQRHDEARELDRKTVEMIEAVAHATGNPVPERIMFSTGKFTTLGEFSLSKYAANSGI